MRLFFLGAGKRTGWWCVCRHSEDRLNECSGIGDKSLQCAFAIACHHASYTYIHVIVPPPNCRLFPKGCCLVKSLFLVCLSRLPLDNVQEDCKLSLDLNVPWQLHKSVPSHLLQYSSYSSIVSLLLFSYSIEGGVCGGLGTEREALFEVSVSITQCTPELANGEVV